MADTLNSIYCPACNSKMTKIKLPDVDFHIDICLDGCGGILFDNRELKTVLSLEEVIDKIIEAQENKEYKAVNTSEVRKCPVCHRPMVKLGNNNAVEIDVCNSCGAKFLDYGELQKAKELNNHNK